MDGGLNDKWLSVAELARRSDIPESTTRRYLTRFDSFFRVEERSRGRRYHPDSVAVLVRIQSLYGAGAESEEINRILGEEFPIMIPVTVGEEEPPPPPVAPYATREDVQTLYVVLESLRIEMRAAREENSQLRLLVESQSNQDQIRQKVLQLEEDLRQKEQELNELKTKKPWWKLW